METMPAQIAEDNQAQLRDTIQFLVFQCSNGFFGINILETHEILKPVQVTRLPNVEAEVLGVINLRGNIIPVIDMNKKFSGKYTELTNFSRIIVCASKGRHMGVLVDRVHEVARLSDADIEGGEVQGFSNNYVSGVGRSGNRIFLILNLAPLIEQSAATQVQEVK